MMHHNKYGRLLKSKAAEAFTSLFFVMSCTVGVVCVDVTHTLYY